MTAENKNAQMIAGLIENAIEFTFPDHPPKHGDMRSAPRQIRMGSEGKVTPKDWLVKGILG